MSGIVLNIGYCQTHAKGGDPGNCSYLPGEEHASWLEECVLLWRKLTGWPVLVSITGFPGITEVNNSQNSRERDVLWRVWNMVGVRFVTTFANPGHQVGAALCVRLGLEAAHHMGYEFMVHTAEDVVPAKWTPNLLKHRLAGTGRDDCDYERGHDYAGEAWGHSGEHLNAQFFGCRVSSLVGPFDPAKVTEFGHLEAYLAHCMDGKECWAAMPAGWYRHTHDHSTWTAWAKEARP